MEMNEQGGEGTVERSALAWVRFFRAPVATGRTLAFYSLWDGTRCGPLGDLEQSMLRIYFKASRSMWAS